MKTMRKIVCLALAMVMMLAMSMTAFATETSEKTNVTVTLSNVPTEKVVVKYGQIVEADRGSKNGWKMSVTADETYNLTKLMALGEAQKADTNEKADLVNGVMTTNSEIAAAATAYANAAQTTVSAGENNNYSFNVTNAGLYVVTVSGKDFVAVPMLVYVAADQTGEVALKVKGSGITISKDIVSDNDKSVDAGDVVKFNATVNYPFIAKADTNKTFVVTDKLTNATFSKDTVVKVGQTTLTAADVTVEYSDNNDVMTITFNYNDSYAGQQVVIDYSVIAGDDDVTNEIDAQVGDKHTSDKVVLDEVSVKIIKVDSKNKEIKLAGAKFQLYKSTDNGDVKIGEEKTTDENGEVSWTGLDAQDTYYVVETEAPVGYALPANQITLLKNGVETTVNASKEYKFNDFADTTIENTTLSSLPFTGGMGTTIFTVLGVAIMAMASALFFATRRKAA